MSAMTSQGSAYTRFQRAMNSRDLDVVVPALAELPDVALTDALDVLELMAERHDARYDRAAAKFSARLTTERRLTVEESRRVLALVEVLPLAPQPVSDHLRLYCKRSLRGPTGPPPELT
jgi:uncharacterized protein (DUF2384 family)